MTEHGDGKRQSPGEPLVAGEHLPDSRGQGFHLWNLGRPVELASRNGPRATRSFSPSSLRTRGGPQENECPGKQGSVRSFENLFAKLSSKRACRSAVRRKYTWSNPSIRCLETCATHISRSCAARLSLSIGQKLGRHREENKMSTFQDTVLCNRQRREQSSCERRQNVQNTQLDASLHSDLRQA